MAEIGFVPETKLVRQMLDFLAFPQQVASFDDANLAEPCFNGDSYALFGYACEGAPTDPECLTKTSHIPFAF